MTPARLLPWALRALWAALPLATGAGLGDALAEHSHGLAAAATVESWAVWSVVLVATLVPHPWSLTVVRMATPVALGEAVATSFAGHTSALALVDAVLVVAIGFLPECGAWFVNGPAYVDERRFLLRVPGALLLGPIELAWAVAVGAPLAGVLLAASDRVIAGAGLLAVGLPAAAITVRALHGLSRRWLVFVPAGVVLHDPMTIVDPVLFERKVIESLHPAPAGSDSLDLTQRAVGLALELVLVDKVPMVLRKPRRGDEAGASARLLFTPTRPGALLAEAAARRIG